MQATLPKRIPHDNPLEKQFPDNAFRGSDLRNNDPREKLIVALDVSTAAAAQKIVAAVGESALTYKVGMQLYTAEGAGGEGSCRLRSASISRPQISRHSEHGRSGGARSF